MTAQTINEFLIAQLNELEFDEWEDVKGFIESEAPDHIKALVNLMGEEFMQDLDRGLFEVTYQVNEIHQRIASFSNVEDTFADYLHEMHGDIKIAGSTFEPAEILEKLDPYRYREALEEYINYDYEAIEDEWRDLVGHLRKLADKYPQIYDFCKATLEQVRQMLTHEVLNTAEAEYQDNLKYIFEGGEL